MKLLSTKDIAREMGLHTRTVKRWWKRLAVPPFIAGNSCHRWTRPQFNTLLRRWRKHTERVRQARQGGWTRRPVTG